MKPNLDYFAGAPVVEIVSGKENWDWTIKLDDGSLIRNHDQRRTAKPGLIIGYRYSHYELNELTNTDNVDLYFSNGPDMQAVTFTRTQITIADPHLPSKDAVYPFVEDAEEPLPNPWPPNDAG